MKIVHVAAQRPWWLRLFRRQFPGSATEQVERMRALAVGGRAPEVVQVSGASIAHAICVEAKRGCDVIMLGSGEGPSIGGRGGRTGGRARRPATWPS